MRMNTLEMHGTGTALGDPIEFGAAAAVLSTQQGSSQSSQKLCLTAQSAKASIGHSEAAAGVMGILHAQAGLIASNSPGTMFDT